MGNGGYGGRGYSSRPPYQQPMGGRNNFYPNQGGGRGRGFRNQNGNQSYYNNNNNYNNNYSNNYNNHSGYPQNNSIYRNNNSNSYHNNSNNYTNGYGGNDSVEYQGSHQSSYSSSHYSNQSSSHTNGFKATMNPAANNFANATNPQDINAVNGLIYHVQFKCYTRFYILSGYAVNATVNQGDFVVVEGDRGEDIGVVIDVLNVDAFVAKRVAMRQAASAAHTASALSAMHRTHASGGLSSSPPSSATTNSSLSGGGSYNYHSGGSGGMMGDDVSGSGGFNSPNVPPLPPPSPDECNPNDQDQYVIGRIIRVASTNEQALLPDIFHDEETVLQVSCIF
jgi:hypothetical protein